MHFDNYNENEQCGKSRANYTSRETNPDIINSYPLLSNLKLCPYPQVLSGKMAIRGVFTHLSMIHAFFPNNLEC
jgi:hypothetical protein